LVRSKQVFNNMTKKLKTEYYNGFEIESYTMFDNDNNVVVFGYAYIKGNSTNKNNYKYKYKGTSKNNVLKFLKHKISSNNKTPKVSLDDSIKILKKNFNNILVIDEKNKKHYETLYPEMKTFISIGDYLMFNGDEFNWIKKRVKFLYNIIIIKQKEIVINDNSFVIFKIK